MSLLSTIAKAAVGALESQLVGLEPAAIEAVLNELTQVSTIIGEYLVSKTSAPVLAPAVAPEVSAQ